MRIFIASDHAGYFLKEFIEEEFKIRGIKCDDMGNHEFQELDDYPDFIIPCAEKVAELSRTEKDIYGIILGRSGNGEAIAANKVRGIRAAVCISAEMAKKAREDNDANIISIGENFVLREEIMSIVDTFLKTPFKGEERHKRRIEKITNYESSKRR